MTEGNKGLGTETWSSWQPSPPARQHEKAQAEVREPTGQPLPTRQQAPDKRTDFHPSPYLQDRDSTCSAEGGRPRPRRQCDRHRVTHSRKITLLLTPQRAKHLGPLEDEESLPPSARLAFSDYQQVIGTSWLGCCVLPSLGGR